jgi:hypothetical protein
MEAARGEAWSGRRLAGVSTGPQPASAVVCAVPMYLEQEIAGETVRFWHQLVSEADIDEVVFVTTAKERPVGRPSTRELVEAELAAFGDQEGAARLRLLHCREEARFRAPQLNLAADHARQRHAPGSDEPRVWLGVYNADSRPHASTFGELRARACEEPGTRVFQQLVDYVVPTRPGTGLVAAGNSILQTWWTRSHYWARNQRGSRGRSWWARTSPYSTFGHGEFVRLDFIDDIGGFPDFAYADGLLLGWIARLRGEGLGLLASRDRAEVPRTARDLVTQQMAWMRGLLNFAAAVRWCRAGGFLGLSRAEVAALRCQHMAIPVAWGLSSVAVAAAAAGAGWRAVAGGATAGDLATLAGLAAYPALPAVALRAEHLRERPLPARVAAATASWAVEGLAFWPALLRHVRRSQDPPAKTPR